MLWWAKMILSIWLKTKISRVFGIMERTHDGQPYFVITVNYLFLWLRAGGILRILLSDWFQERAVFFYLLTTVMVTNYTKRRVKLQIERAKFQFVLIIFCNRAVLLFNFLIKKQWILTKAITVMSFVDMLMRQRVK